MATIREHLLDIITDIIAEGNETQAALTDALVSGDDTAISVLLSILSALATPDTGINSLLLSVDGLRADLADYHTVTLGAINDGFALVDSTLQLINTKVGVTNTILQDNVVPPLALIYNQLLAIGRNQLALACICDAGNPALPPPLDLTSPTDLLEHCRRVQYFIDHLTDGICAASEAIAGGLNVTSDLAATFFGAGIIPGIALANIPTALLTGAIIVLGQMASDKIMEPCNWLSDNSEGLINALYNAQTAAQAQEAWYAYVDAHTNAVSDLDLRLILKAGAWSAGMNAIYNAALEWDTSAYNANDCGEFDGCFTSESEDVVVTNWSYITKSSGWNDPNIEWLTQCNSSGGLITFSKPFLAWGDFTNYTFEVISGSVQLYYRVDGPNGTTNMSILNYTPATGVFFAPGTQLLINFHGGNNGVLDYVLKVCPNGRA